jgi:hypothetical protein
MKTKEEIKLEFFKKFDNESFRGYPLEQCNSIWDFFEKHIQCQEDNKDWFDKYQFEAKNANDLLAENIKLKKIIEKMKKSRKLTLGTLDADDLDKAKLNLKRQIINIIDFYNTLNINKQDKEDMIKEVDVVCPKCKGVNEYLISEKGDYKCAYTDCQHKF